MSVCVFTVSKALDMSRATIIVRWCGFLMLNPCEIFSCILCRAVDVECSFLNPCCVSVLGMFCVMSGSMIFSRILTIGDSKEIGLYEVPSSGFLFGFKIGTIFASFQISGITLVLRDFSTMLRKYSSALGPKYFKCFMFKLSGPVELLFF